MQSTRPETSPVKAGRRVLGEKNTNASLTPAAAKRHADKQQHKPITDAIPFNPLKETRKNREVSTEPLHAGQKRTIDQVTDSETEDVAPRKAIVTSAQSETDQDFQIFDDNNSNDNNTRPISPSREVSPTGVTVTQASEKLIPSQRNKSLLDGETEETSTSISASSVPTEPAARRIFIQEKAALVRQRLQSAMHRVGNNNSLDRALSQFEASSRPFVPRGNTNTTVSRASSSPSFIIAAAASKSASPSQESSPKQEKRVLLPPLPIQPHSRPVRASARTSIPSPFSESASITAPPQEEEEDKEEEKEEEEENDDEDEETPKAQAVNQQRPAANVEEMKAALDKANALHKLKELAQSSTNAEQTVGR